MKVAFWAIGIMVLSFLGIILINLFGNITVTNQLNYTTMKNAVDASMNDSLDQEYFGKGFCVCTDKSVTDENKWVFTDKSQYELVDITYKDGEETCVSKKKNCKMLVGEYRINTKNFVESITRRFVEMINNNKKYRIIIQEVIEYPPKVSVRIVSSDDEFSPTEKNSGGYDIVNQIDSIIETEGFVVLNNTNGKKIVCDNAPPTPEPKKTTAPVSAYCEMTYNQATNTVSISKVVTTGNLRVMREAINGYTGKSLVVKNPGTYTGIVYFSDGKSVTCKVDVGFKGSTPTPTSAPTVTATPGTYSCSMRYDAKADMITITTYASDNSKPTSIMINNQRVQGSSYRPPATGSYVATVSFGGEHTATCKVDVNKPRLTPTPYVKTGGTPPPRTSQPSQPVQSSKPSQPVQSSKPVQTSKPSSGGGGLTCKDDTKPNSNRFSACAGHD